MSKLKSPIALVILDGWGIGRADDPFNAVAKGNTPHMTLYSEMYPHTTLACSGEAVGLPDGQMGNSEVGHLNIGAGRVVYQELTRITKAIRDGEFYQNPVLLQVMNETKQKDGALHLMGLLSDGGVHSHIGHLKALVAMAKEQGLKEVYIHAFLDGRDVPPSSAKAYIDELEAAMAQTGIGAIATIAGRYYAMDRDKRWERTQLAYDAIVSRTGFQAKTAVEALQAAYERGETDEFVKPTAVACSTCGVKAGDGIVFFNFRPDRARQLTQTFIKEDFAGFVREKGYLPVQFASMTQYDETFGVPVAYPPQEIRQTLGQVFSEAGLKQLRIAETEKYAHVTYFFNGGEEQPYEGEDRALIPSPKVATYDLKPSMSAVEVTDRVVAEIQSGKHDLIILNFANGDMVGHTGVMNAAVSAVETVDTCLGRVVDALHDRGGIVLVTADHGNAEYMYDEVNKTPFTAHTTNRVPLILISEQHRGAKLKEGRLADLAPTILDLAKVTQPAVMTGTSLLEK
ncbi:MAG: 2,3-bisphosphoglycerate-independent phosphoglycerate mutase [Sporomusaceae bacterium]|nr:2,3-bisphosphoglycerate-independent phosphoglycerate mutase [Sporomusaceae bacterium]